MQNRNATTSTAPNKKLDPQDHALIGRSANIPVNPSTTIFSVSPIIITSPGRPVDLQMKVSGPTTGKDLPIILLSHGQGQSNNLSSLNGYGPLVNFWAAHGFVVIQPTHLSSRALALTSDDPKDIFFWRSRVKDMKRILDNIDLIEASVPELKGRLDRNKIAAVGHSMGGHTVGMLLGAQLTDPADGTRENMFEPRIKAGVLLAVPGSGGKDGSDLSPFAFDKLAFFRHPSFTEMKTQTLVVVGDKDVSPHLTTRGADWHADPYFLSTGSKSLLTLVDAGHGLGGVSGYDVAETTDESPERLAIVQRMTWAYIRSALNPHDSSWSTARAALGELTELARIESK